ncbi:MAG: ethanolamine utilization microcompartment protein EutL [Myxococcaceae bacterium]|nr:ethanolamine utilization microcompartment protein EutL [Myxococcaceae bacterium]
MTTLRPSPPRLLSVRLLEQIEPSLGRALGCGERHVSVGLVTCDQDDSLYAALDHATKFADVDVVYAKSFYAGSAHASGPLSGEILGVLAGPNPDEVKEGLWALREALNRSIHFVTLDGTTGPAFFPHVIEETGRYLAPLAGVPVGSPLAYLIAPPTEALVGLDAALKSANVKLVKFFGPPTETNFAGGYLSGSVADVHAAARAFTEAVVSVIRAPQAGLVRPERERR